MGFCEQGHIAKYVKITLMRKISMFTVCIYFCKTLQKLCKFTYLL